MKVIANKFPGKCTACNAQVAKGAGFASREGSKWVLRCTKDQGETNGANNPWRDIHMGDEMAYTGGEYTRGMGRKAVDNEYSGTDALAEPCDNCGGTCHWRATVGARICPDCGTMIVYRWIKGTLDFERKLVSTRTAESARELRTAR